MSRRSGPGSLHLATNRGSVAMSGAWTRNFGQWQEFEIGVFVNTVAEGRCDRTELFPVERLDDAVQRFWALTG